MAASPGKRWCGLRADGDAELQWSQWVEQWEQ